MTDEPLPICCVCGQEIDGNVEMTPGGRAHHPACTPTPDSVVGEGHKVRSLGEFAERKARDAMHGRGQATLDEDAS